MVAEIAHSSRAIDLHLKKQRYDLAGVFEYIVVSLDPEELYWFDLRSHKELHADADGIFRSIEFPGLWIHGDGLLELDHELTSRALALGLQSSEHTAFVDRLARAKRSRK